DPDHLVRVMATSPSYLRTAEDGAVRNLRDWGLSLARRFRALKLWFVLRDEGTAGIAARVRRDLEHARWLAAQVDAAAAAGWQRLAPVPLQTVCLHPAPAHLPPEAWDAHNLALARRVNASGRAFVTAAVVGGVQLIRVSIGAAATTRADVAAVWALLQEL